MNIHLKEHFNYFINYIVRLNLSQTIRTHIQMLTSTQEKS